MDPEEAEREEAIDELLLEQWFADPTVRDWYAELIKRMLQASLPDLWYHDRSTASERKIDMSFVKGTVGTIDPTAVCDDPNCAQRGQQYKDHVVVHKNTGAKKGLRGECPECKGPMHNLKDDEKLIAFACIWRQAFGSNAKKTPVSAVTLDQCANAISRGKITKWATRSLMSSILAAPKAPSPAATAQASASTKPSAPVAAAGSSAPASSTSPVPPATSAAPAAAKAAPDPEKKRKLAELMRSGKVAP